MMRARRTEILTLVVAGLLLASASASLRVETDRSLVALELGTGGVSVTIKALSESAL